MPQYKNAHSATLRKWPSNWDALLKILETHAQATSPTFWNSLVNTYLANITLDNEQAYKNFFKHFWTVDRTKIITVPDNVFEAAANGYDVYIKNVLDDHDPSEQQTLLNKQNDDGNTALHLAVDKRHSKTVEVLLQHGADPNIQGFFHETPLHRAAVSNLSEITQLLLNNGADRGAVRSDHKCPIHAAAMVGAANTVEILAQSDATQKTITTKDSDRSTAFQVAALHGQLEVMDILLQNGDDPNQTDRLNNSMVHLAASKNNADMINLLYKHGADLNKTGYGGWTALQRCAMESIPKLIAAQTLIYNGAEVNPAQNAPPLYLLATQASQRSPKTLEFAKYLIDRGARLDAMTDSQTAYDALKQLKDRGELKQDELGMYQYLSECLGINRKSSWMSNVPFPAK